MRRTYRLLCLPLIIAMASCNKSSTSAPFVPAPAPPLPPPSNAIAVPAGVSASSGYQVSVFAASPAGSSKPDSLAQVGNNVFVGFGNSVNPDGTPAGSQTQVAQYDLSGNLQKTYNVIGHNDGLMKFDSNTLWAMSNEDGNPTLVIINISAGTQQTYLPQAGLEDANGALAHGGGLDDMQIVNGQVYVSASNPAVSTTATCPANSSTPGCPNGVNTGNFAYTLTLNSGASTFNLTPVAASSTPATNIATSASGTLNITDPDSEVVTPDGTTLIVDGQGDSELAFIKNPGASQTVSFLPLAGQPQVDDTRFVPSAQTFLLAADTPGNLIYRIDGAGAFNSGDAYSATTGSNAGQNAVVKLNLSTGASSAIVSGLQAPHGLVFVTASGSSSKARKPSK